MTHSLGGRTGSSGTQPWAQSGELKEINLGQVSEAKLTWTNVTKVTVSTNSKLLLEANNGTSRTVAIKLMVDADTGLHIALGPDDANTTATTDHFVIEPGEILILTTPQRIEGIRAAAATTDVDAYLIEGEVL